jgi:hypothetical protein
MAWPKRVRQPLRMAEIGAIPGHMRASSALRPGNASFSPDHCPVRRNRPHPKAGDSREQQTEEGHDSGRFVDAAHCGGNDPPRSG